MQTFTTAAPITFRIPSFHLKTNNAICSPSQSPLSPASPSGHCALTADAAFERCSGQAMQSLPLPRPSSILPTPFGRHAGEPEDCLAKFRQKFSPTRAEQQGYPSPPMSEPHSPPRRPAQSVEPGRLSYPSNVNAPQRSEPVRPLPPSSSSLYDSRSVLALQGNFQQRPLYPGDPTQRGQPLHYQPGTAGDHAPYGNVPLPPSYGYGYPNAGPPPYAGAQHAGPMAQQATMIAPPPNRPTKPARRTKAHVASACVNCKKAHLSCDVQRPCGRCVASGKQDSCKDVQHKKRGRPRLRDDRDFTRPEEGQQSGQILGGVPTSDTFSHQGPFPISHSHRMSDPPRALGITMHGKDLPNTSSQTTPSSNGSQSSRVGGFSAAPNSLYPSGQKLVYQSLPVAFLNLDLVIQKSNQAFQDLMSFLGNVRGKHLGDLLDARQHDSLQRLCNELRDERDEREPTYMAPITPIGQDPMKAVMESVKEQDIDSFTHGFTDRPMLLSFRLPGNGQHQSLQVQVRLAKTSLYFVTLAVLSPPRITAPPLLTQQLAPPTPTYDSQTRSAPSTASGSYFTAHQARPSTSINSAPNSPYFNLSSARSSLPAFSPSSFHSSPTYNYPPRALADTGFPASPHNLQPGSGYPSPYPPMPRHRSVTSAPLNEINRQGHAQGLHLPPIRTGPAPLGSPLSVGSGSQSALEQNNRVRRRDSLSSADQRPETPETSKRRRLNIHEVLE